MAILGFYFYFKSTHSPLYKGELQLKALENEVEVYFTEFGIPHIYAKSDKDAYYALGYVHAQDRLWQMDLLRHVWSGRLSELFGSDLIDTDKYLRTMGLDKYSKESAKKYLQRNHETLPLVQAYLSGINEYIMNNPKTLEHTVLGLDVEPFTEEHIFGVITYMAFSFSNAQKTDPVLTELSSKLDSTYLEDLQIYHYKGESTLKNYDDRYASMSNDVVALLSKLNVPEFIGSNSWVLSGEKTESGQVILANDPHIGFSQPAVWYEAHLVMPSTEYYGYFIAGSPFPPILHTPDLSNGLTMFENDDMDFYIEEIHPEDSNVYRYKDEWVEMTSRNETIKVKNDEDVEFSIRTTKHGPIVSDILGKEPEEPLEEIVSMFWVTTNFDNYSIESLHGFTVATSLTDVEESVEMIHGPGLNIMYGDAKGNIAWWAAGKLIKRVDERTSKTFYDGTNASTDPDEFYPFEKNPHSINPPRGFVLSANNQPDTVDRVIYSGYYLPDDRAERINELINSQEKFNTDMVKSMTQDTRSKTFENIKGILLFEIKDIGDPELLRALISWDSSFEKDYFQPVLMQKWVYEILESSLMDEMGEDLWELYKSTHTYKVAIEHLIRNEDSKWWDDVNTEQVEDRSQIIKNSFSKAMNELKEYWDSDYKKWTWGKTHILSHNHAMGVALSFLNIGPFPAPGGNEVINNLGYTYSGEKNLNILFGPSTRRIVDFSDVRNNSWSILPTGQSGNYFSPHYADQAEMFIKGEFREMKMNRIEIEKSENKLVLLPF